MSHPLLGTLDDGRRPQALEHSVEAARREVAALYSECAAELLSYALLCAPDQETARDALHEAFMRYFIGLLNGDRIASPRAWIYRVARNYLLDRIKEVRHRRQGSLEEAGRYPDDRHDVEAACWRREVMGLLRSRLTAREYDCFRLRAEGLPYQEIARTLKLRSGTVGALLSRAVRKIRGAVGGVEVGTL